MMLNSSVMVGWISENGFAIIKQYFLAGLTPTDVKPDKGDLPLTSVPPFVTVYGATIYLAFQLNFAASSSLSTRQEISLAFVTRYLSHNRVTPHNVKAAFRFNFSAGNIDQVSASGASAPDDIFNTIRTHGVLGLVGRGLILPVGPIVARYFRHLDPLCFYLHQAEQYGIFSGQVMTAVKDACTLQGGRTAEETSSCGRLVFL